MQAEALAAPAASVQDSAAEQPARATEPTTARALWPTFMRRTLPEENLGEPAPRPVRPGY